MELIKQLQGKRVYFDTNIVIYLVEGLEACREIIKAITELLETYACKAVTSELTLCEALIQPYKIKSQKGLALYRSFLEESGVFNLITTDRSIFIASASVSAKTRMKVPDSIHVATAAASECDVFLTNDQHIKTPATIKKILLSDYIS